MNGMARIQEMAELDLNDPLFKTDAFMVYGFKVLPCRRTRRHDWRECPFAHPGEVARRRDPQIYSYVGIICPDAKQNAPCPRGERCPYTHSLFEYWLHPTRYKTEFCSRGRQCTRPFCFFAHSETEMRPVDTEALLSVAMRPNIETSLTTSTLPLSAASVDVAIDHTTGLLEKMHLFRSPIRSQSFTDRSVPRTGMYLSNLADVRGMPSERSVPVLQQGSSWTSPWDTIYENEHVNATQEAAADFQRRYSMSDAGNPSDVISRLGVGYLQQSAKQRLLQQDFDGYMVGGGGQTTMSMPPLANVPVSPASFNSLLGNAGRHSKSLDSSLLTSVADAQLHAFLNERGRSLPTTLAQSPSDYY